MLDSPSGLCLAGASVIVKKKQKKADLAGASGDSVHRVSSAGTRDESRTPPSSNQEHFLPSELLLVSTTVAPGVLVVPALILLLDVCPLSQRYRSARTECSRGGDITTHLLSLPQTNGL